MTDKYSVRDTLVSLGVTDGDVLLFRSSLKSFGYIEGGADAVIDGALLAVGERGTLVAPTLVQRDFQHAYQNWDRETTPSDVGVITEVFRKRKNALRSDQATHSVAAIGRLAEYLTEGHTAFGPRHSIYGDYAFSVSSPWQKMYDLGGKVVFMGVSIETNTYRHFIEARSIERARTAFPTSPSVSKRGRHAPGRSTRTSASPSRSCASARTAPSCCIIESPSDRFMQKAADAFPFGSASTAFCFVM